MKHRFTLLMTAFLLLTGRTLWGQSQTEVSIDFSAQGYENAQEMDGLVIDIDENVTVVFNIGTGSNGPKYYNMGSSIRAYSGNNFVVSSTGTISSITLTFGSGDGSNEILTEVGSFESPVWTGSNSEVTFTIGGTSGHRRIKEIAVIYSLGSAPQQYVATPTFSPEEGVYNEPQFVTIDCATEGATIRYTLDGTVPTEESPVFATALTIEETTTVKAKAWKADYQPSPVATATYSITNMITIAEARALEDNEYATIQGVVTFIDNRNIYIQDSTAGIDLFLNSGTTPSSLVLGDMVRAYGKKTVYNGLVELTSIDGGDTNAFSILSSGNELPLSIQTIESINTDFNGENMLQATRVKIENVIIGTINPNSTTVISQGDNTLNIYQIPTVEGLAEGDTITVTGIISCFYTPQLRVASAEDIEFTQTPTPPTPSTGNYVRINDLNNLTPGSYVVFAARFDENATDYYAMNNTSSGKPIGILFTSATADENEVLPASIVDEESNYYWIVGVTANSYTFTNANGELIGYSSGTNFATGGENTEWAIELSTAGDEAMVPNYTGFVINNVNNPVRCFALNSNHNFGPYHTNNLNNSGYNFYLDLFVKTEGGDPPTPTVATPTFTPAAGTYYEPQTVSITCTTEGAEIHFTLDGSEPTETSPTYDNTPLNIEVTTTVKAIAIKEGYNNSAIAEATYTIQLGAVTIFNQDWEGEMNGWTFVTVEGSKPWTVGQHQGNHYAYANGYNGGVNEQWCISPAFNINDYENVTLSFRNAKNYTGPDLELKYSTNYDGVDPTAADWWTIDFNMSPGSYTWVESGNIPISIYPAYSTNCYIAFKYISTETEAAAWEVDDITLIGFTTEPNISVTPSSLSGFTHIVGEGPSASQYFTLSGVNIGPAPGGGSTGSVVIQSMENEFKISLDNEEFTWQLYIDSIAGTLAPTPIYVRMNGAEVGQYSGIVNIYASSSDEATVTLSGTVTEPPIPSENYVRINDINQLADGNQVIFAARYNETANAYLAIVDTLANGKLSTTEFTSQMNGTDEIIPANIMADEDSYYWTVGVTSDGYTFTNSKGDMIGYGTSGTSFVMNSERTAWNIENGVSDPASLVPGYYGFKITNATTTSRCMALRVTDANSVVGAYSTNNLTNVEYNFFLDIFLQGEGGTPTVATPTFSPEGGTYYGTQTVTISCATNDVTIHYTLDGSIPDTFSPIYETPLDIENTTTIKAFAVKDGYIPSGIAEATYTIQDDIAIIFNQDWENGWQGWTEYCEMGDSLWHIGFYQGNHYAYANGYNHPASVDWLISPSFDLDSYSNEVLTFRTALNYNGPDIEVFFSNDYDGQEPITATWELLECELSHGGWNWVTAEVSLDGFNGSNCHIAFKYTSLDGEAAAWEIDDIMLVSGGATPTPTLTATPNTLCDFEYMEGIGPSASQSYTLSGANLEGEGNIIITVSSYFEISTNNESFGTEPIEIPYANGELLNQPVTIYVRLAGGLEVGTYTGTINHEGGNATTEVNLCGTVHSENEPSIAWNDLPHYIQGNNGSNNNRVPVATYIGLQNLEPSTTYRYTNQFVDENDGPETAGAGNVIYANLEGFYRSTSPSLATEGNYGEFTTDGDGDAYVWFVNEPTANARFTPGNHVYLRIRLNDGHDGTTVEHVFTTENYATVINFGTEHNANQGTAFYVKSNENSMTFAQMFTGYMDPQNPDSRPIYSTIVETTGVDFGSINQYADFYKEEVAGKDGWFGGILPNDNEYGINEIVVFDITHYWFQEYHSAEYTGHWNPDANTVNPNSGLDEPIFIDLTDDGVEEAIETNVKVWSADHEFVIENDDNAHYTMTVYNILGQPMMQKQINAGSTEHIRHSLASGVYVINLQNSQNKVAVKVMVR